MPTYEGYRVRSVLVRENEDRPRVELRTGQAVSDFMRSLGDADREYFCVILLNSQGEVIGVEEVSIGDLTGTLAGPPEVFRSALLAGTFTVVLVHNHPSGNLSFSPQDIQLTKRLYEVGRLLHIPVYDHVLITSSGYLSMREQGFITVISAV